MKKFLNSLILMVMILLTGYNEVNASDYISTVKNMNAREDEKMEELANRLLRQSEFYLLNKETFAFGDHEMQRVVLSYQIAPEEMFKQIKEVNPLLPEMKNLKWEIEGKTKKGKVVTFSSDLVLVKIPTEDDGDYIKSNIKDIQVYNKENNSRVNINQIDIAMFYLEIIDKYGYKPAEEKKWYKSVEFYPSGRTKKLLVGDSEVKYEDKPVNLEELTKSVTEVSNWINNYKFTKDDDGGHFSYLLIGPKVKLKGASLSKNLTTIEKNKLNNLTNILNKAEERYKKARNIKN